MSFETVLVLVMPVQSSTLMLMRIWPGYLSMMTFEILLWRAFWKVGSLYSAAQLHISYYENGIYLPDGCSRHCVVGGFFSCTLQGGQMGDNLEFFGDILGLFMALGLFD
jgi:hypothetical protein